MKRSLLLSLLITVATISMAQPFGMGGVTWMADGNSYASVEKYTITLTELPSMSKKVLYDLDKLIPRNEKQPRTISSFLFSKDTRSVLLKINTKTKYHKTTGEV